MMGYIIASVVTSWSHHSNTCLNLLCWRWPFLIEVILLAPLMIGLCFIPKEDMAVKIYNSNKFQNSSNSKISSYTPLKRESMLNNTFQSINKNIDIDSDGNITSNTTTNNDLLNSTFKDVELQQQQNDDDNYCLCDKENGKNNSFKKIKNNRTVDSNLYCQYCKNKFNSKSSQNSLFNNNEYNSNVLSTNKKNNEKNKEVESNFNNFFYSNNATILTPLKKLKYENYVSLNKKFMLTL
jgi:hypothetical protein